MDRYDRYHNTNNDRYYNTNNDIINTTDDSHQYYNNTFTNRRRFSSPDAPLFNDNNRGNGRLTQIAHDFQPVYAGGDHSDLRNNDGRGFGGSENYQMRIPPVVGQKRGYPFADREKSSDRLDGAGFAKLFVGSVPRSATEEDIQPLFDRHGHVLEVALIKDKRTGQQQGCCFIKYASSEEADRAIKGLHNKCTLPGGVAPIQVRYADGERERLGATEYKLFVGALNKQATETEIEEIFSCYGRVEDIYLMRDEMKQSRGCAFVKYSKLEMAHAAINALNGIYTMRGCNQPLTVRFADNKRSRPGDSRVGPAFGNTGGPAFGNTGFGPHPSASRSRPAQNIIEPLRGSNPPNPWPPVSPQNMHPPSNVVHTFNSQLPARSGVAPTSNTPGPVSAIPANPDGSHPGSTFSSDPISQKYNHSLPQAPPSGLNQSPSQRPLPSPPNAAPFPNMQGSRGPHLQQGQVQMPYNEYRNRYFQNPPSQQLPGPNGQLPVTQPQRQHNSTPGPGQQAAAANQQQPSVQELHQPPSQLAQMASQQKQTLQATFQSSQQTFNQLQQQMQQLQPSNQNRTAHQGPHATNQQAPWTGISSQAATSTTAASAPAPPAVTPNCNWSEHLSPQGYMYYYNGVTGESKWEKPEELKAYEQQQLQKPFNQYNQAEHRPQGLPTNHGTPQMQVPLQGQHVQFQSQIRPFQQPSQSSFQAPGLSDKKGNKELDYAQIPPGNATMNNPARYQQASQEWMWKNKTSGT